jgi:hypothetical protein
LETLPSLLGIYYAQKQCHALALCYWLEVWVSIIIITRQHHQWVSTLGQEESRLFCTDHKSELD